MTERNMVEIKKIEEIKPIEGADKIVSYRIGGWWVIDQKDRYQVGDRIVYCSIDSWIPTSIAPFLSKGKEPKVYYNVPGEKLRTIRLRGQISQGLILPLSVLPEAQYNIDQRLDDILGVQKWEMEIPASLAGKAKGSFPSFIEKTDQTRIQNLTDKFHKLNCKMFQVQEKLEGSSATFYLRGGEFGVCSRNLELHRDEGNTFWQVAIENDIESKLRHYSGGFDIAIQGELIGPGIQGNIYKLAKHTVRFFDVFNISAFAYFNPLEAQKFIEKMGLNFVPVLGEYIFNDSTTVDKLLEMAEGHSQLYATQREGLVFKFVGNDGLTFKVISNSYLEKQK
jgi:RNA ligase (TIGR02306 family)